MSIRHPALTTLTQQSPTASRYDWKSEMAYVSWGTRRAVATIIHSRRAVPPILLKSDNGFLLLPDDRHLMRNGFLLLPDDGMVFGVSLLQLTNTLLEGGQLIGKGRPSMLNAILNASTA
jgi:hypothetical protein